MTVSNIYLLIRADQAHADKKSAQKKWKGFKKAKTVCTTTKYSPDSPILSDQIIKQLQILIDFLLREESKYRQ